MEVRGWSKIAAFFDVSVSTARRWFREEQLPVHRKKGRVYCLKRELNEWKKKYNKGKIELAPCLQSDRNTRVRRTVRNERKRQGISLRKMANAIGVSTTTYFELESGRYRISVDRLDQILKVLGMKITQVWPR